MSVTFTEMFSQKSEVWTTARPAINQGWSPQFPPFPIVSPALAALCTLLLPSPHFTWGDPISSCSLLTWALWTQLLSFQQYMCQALPHLRALVLAVSSTWNVLAGPVCPPWGFSWASHHAVLESSPLFVPFKALCVWQLFTCLLVWYLFCLRHPFYEGKVRPAVTPVLRTLPASLQMFKNVLGGCGSEWFSNWPQSHSSPLAEAEFAFGLNDLAFMWLIPILYYLSFF